MEKEIICTVCPRGCHIQVEGERETVRQVTGYICKRGLEYATAEFTHPVRIPVSYTHLMGSRYYYLGLDQGTTGTTALLLDESWNQIARGHVDIRQYYPKAGWVEHDPIEIYDSLLEAAVQALRSAGASAREVRCIGCLLYTSGLRRHH